MKSIRLFFFFELLKGKEKRERERERQTGKASEFSNLQV